MSTPSERWRAVDETADPVSFVRFLERTSTGPGDAYPGLELLELNEGERCLDVGCGLGEDARAIAEATGTVVLGVDRSVRLAAEAARRSWGSPALLFAVGDGTALPLPDSTFDAAAIKRTLMHLPEPEPVIREMVRVVRPGDRVVAIEPDSEVLLLDSGLMDVTRRILAFRAAGYGNPWAGRRLRGAAPRSWPRRRASRGTPGRRSNIGVCGAAKSTSLA